MGKSKTTTSGTTDSTLDSTTADTLNNITTQDPFAPALGGIESIIGQANQNLNRERALAPTDPRNIQAADLLTQLAQQEQLGGVTQGGVSFAENLFGNAPIGSDTLAQFAGGQFGLSQDPRFQQNVENQQTRTSDLIRRLSAGAGRGGSPAETGILARELGKIGLDATLGQERFDLGQQLSAAGQLTGQGSGLIGQIGNLQQAQTFAPGLLQQAGNIQQGAQQTELDNILRIIQQQQGVLFPAGGLGGTTEQVGETTGTVSQVGTGLTTGTQINKANPVTQGINLLGALSGFVKPAGVPS